MSTGHNDKQKRAESEKLAKDFEEFLRRGGKPYEAKKGETAIKEVTPLNSRQGKKNTHTLRMAKKEKK